MICFSKPDPATIQTFLGKSQNGHFTYQAIGQSIGHQKIKGFDNDTNRVLLGHGEAIYRSACEAICSWKMFPGGWAYIAPTDAPIEKGQTIAMVARVMGLYWLNDCRIVYVVEEEKPVRRYGFAYGTLEQHVEKGEELFSVEWLADGSVWYVLRAFSKPRFWLARLAYPIARLYQRKFVRESQRAMVSSVGSKQLAVRQSG